MRAGALSAAARRLAVATALVAAGVGLVGQPAFAADAPAPEETAPPAPGEASWSIKPADEQGPDDRPAFELVLPPGREVTEHVAVANLSARELTLTLYASDAFNTPDGGFDLLPADRPPSDVGTWVRVRDSQVRLAAGETAVVPVTLRVPADATPGDHAGGIVASLTTRAVDATGSVFDIDHRVGTRLHVRVPGDVRVGLEITSLTARYEERSRGLRPGAVVVDYTVANTGNLRTAAGEQVDLRGPFGVFDTSAPAAELPEVLPGQSVRRSLRVESVVPTGWLTAQVRVTPANESATASDGPAEASVTVWAAPWPIVAGLTLVVALVALAVLWRRAARRRRRRELERARREGAEAARAEPAGVAAERTGAAPADPTRGEAAGAAAAREPAAPVP